MQRSTVSSKNTNESPEKMYASNSESDKKRTKVVDGYEVSDRIPDALVPLIMFDKKLSSSLAICAGNESALPSLRPHMKGLEISCHFVPWIAGSLILLFFSKTSSSQNIYANIILALLLDIILVAITKAIFRRARPLENNMDMTATISVDVYSFPSGHASRAVMVFFLMAYRCDFSFLVVWLIGFWSLAVCISRVLLGRHHVGDIVGGILLGIVEYAVMTVIWLSPESIDNITWLFFDHDIGEA